MSGYPTFTSILRVDGLSTDPRDLGRHKVDFILVGIIRYTYSVILDCQVESKKLLNYKTILQLYKNYKMINLMKYKKGKNV